MASTYIESTRKLIKTVTEEVIQHYPKSEHTNLSHFVRCYFEFIVLEEIRDYPAKVIAAAMMDSYSMFEKRKEGTPFVKVYNPEIKVHGWNSNHTVITLINDDRPFLVDSVTEALTRLGCDIFHLAHPVMHVVRDKNGKLQEIAPYDKQVTPLEEWHMEERHIEIESLIHVHVTHTDEKEAIASIESHLRDVLKMVKICVEDWRECLQRVNYITTEIAASTESLAQAYEAKERQILREDANEIKEFLQWLKDKNFVFLGYVEYHKPSDKAKKLVKMAGSALGVLSEDESYLTSAVNDISNEPVFDGKELQVINITKGDKKSVVHRPVHMDYISIKHFDDQGYVIGEHRILGMFTSVVYHQSVHAVPIVRRKIVQVKKAFNYPSNSHNGKALVAILEDYPREEIFQLTTPQLIEIMDGVLNLAIRPRVRLFERVDALERFVSCVIFIPKERMSTSLRKKMQAILQQAFNGTVTNHYTQITESHLARLQVIIKTKKGKIPAYNVRDIEAELAKAARLWEDELFHELLERLGGREGRQQHKKYRDAFSAGYTNRFSSEDAYYDIKQIEKVFATGKVAFDFYRPSGKEDQEFEFKIYNPVRQIDLGDIMPYLQNIGLEIIEEHTYTAACENEDVVWIHAFRLGIKKRHDLPFAETKYHFEMAMERMWAGKMHNDGLNELIMLVGLKWYEVMLLRAYSRYLLQATFKYSQDYIRKALGSHVEITRDIVELFYIRFDPDRYGAREKNKREQDEKVVLKRIEKALAAVEHLADDAVMRALVELMKATQRTNFFMGDFASGEQDYISLKVSSSEISFLPKPRPYAEIFVYSTRVEGVHLRGGKVARGGLRWSDRTEDFRTEILGLMKAQMAKNSVIIPVGSKGGFVVKRPPKEGDRDAIMKEGIACYQTFLRGLLDITDNLVDDKVVAPDRVVRHDGDDPYLVVAADKGTASFSDIANAVAEEYKFWLGDAFASGGSVGYDHKKMGITARGAWISVQRHFLEMGIDIQSEDVSTIGIGDMSGDVFGNGMLLSKHIKLVGAFNHLHIFLDPEPDIPASFKERQRLFKLERSGWEDYNPKLISKGGGVFKRSEKSIKLSAEMKDLLSVSDSSLAPDDLIKAMLKADIGLLWNGGIGTYIKSRHESHEEVGDRANDSLRVNGSEVKAKAIGEGGNLGLTQLGRIEYALAGGRINTDAIDNSAGVDCSDHEVNIKIALNKAIEKKKLALKKRDALLESMTEDVAALVLRDNTQQTQSLTIAELQSGSLLEIQAHLMDSLEECGYLDRAIEFLPDDDEIARRKAEKRGLTRPELSVLLAYSKIVLFNDLLETDIADDTYFEEDLIEYFPEALREKYKQSILEHPLRREIIATMIANDLINRMGSALFYSICENTSMSAEKVVKAYTICCDLFQCHQIWEEVEALSHEVSVEVKVEMFTAIQRFVEHVMTWILLHKSGRKLDISHMLQDFGEDIKDLRQCVPSILSEPAKCVYDEISKHYQNVSVPKELGDTIASLQALAAALDIVHVAQTAKLPLNVVGGVYFELGAKLHLSWIRTQLHELMKHSYWQDASIKTLESDLYDEQRRLTSSVVKNLCNDDTCGNAIENWQEQNKLKTERFERFIEDLKSSEEPSVAMYVVALRKVRDI